MVLNLCRCAELTGRRPIVGSVGHLDHTTEVMGPASDQVRAQVGIVARRRPVPLVRARDHEEDPLQGLECTAPVPALCVDRTMATMALPTMVTALQ